MSKKGLENLILTRRQERRRKTANNIPNEIVLMISRKVIGKVSEKINLT